MAEPRAGGLKIVLAIPTDMCILVGQRTKDFPMTNLISSFLNWLDAYAVLEIDTAETI